MHVGHNGTPDFAHNEPAGSEKNIKKTENLYKNRVKLYTIDEILR